MGYTAFDRFVARQRYRVVSPLIRQDARVCDLGTGIETGFLRFVRARLQFGVGLDNLEPQHTPELFPYVRGDLSRGLPFRESAFHHVVMLAVLEHLREPENVLKEAHRILVPGGTLVITYPSAGVDPILRVMNWFRMVSPEEGFHQHQPRLPIGELRSVLQRIGFDSITHGRFELGLNNLVVAHKP